MAEAEPKKHERTLFILLGRSNWQPTMGDFRLDADGNWWFHVVGKGNKSGKIAVRDEYVEKYLKRYRTFIGLGPLPSYQEKTPLLKTLSGRAGLSDRQVRALLQTAPALPEQLSLRSLAPGPASTQRHLGLPWPASHLDELARVCYLSVSSAQWLPLGKGISALPCTNF